MEQFRAWSRQLSAYSIITRYVIGTAVVGIVTVVQLIATPLPGGYVFILYYPVVTLAALLLDRGAGFYATILSAFLTVLLFIGAALQPDHSSPSRCRCPGLGQFRRQIAATAV